MHLPGHFLGIETGEWLDPIALPAGSRNSSAAFVQAHAAFMRWHESDMAMSSSFAPHSVVAAFKFSDGEANASLRLHAPVAMTTNSSS